VGGALFEAGLFGAEAPAELPSCCPDVHAPQLLPHECVALGSGPTWSCLQETTGRSSFSSTGSRLDLECQAPSSPLVKLGPQQPPATPSSFHARHRSTMQLQARKQPREFLFHAITECKAGVRAEHTCEVMSPFSSAESITQCAALIRGESVVAFNNTEVHESGK
jgi:hypothetical protein